MPLFHLIYASRAPRVTPKDIDEIQAVAERHNPSVDITGILLFGGGQFLQILEGDVGPVAELYARVATDRRHCDVSCLYFGPAAHRVFPAWGMGVANLDCCGTPLDRARLTAALATPPRGGSADDLHAHYIAILETFRNLVESDSGAAAQAQDA